MVATASITWNIKNLTKIKMKYILKIMNFYIGKSVHKRYPYGVTWYKNIYHKFLAITRKTFVIGCVFGSIALIAGISSVIYRELSPKIVMADKEVIIEVKTKSPVMDRIAKCESGGNHIEKATGQVVMRSNTNKSVDIGKYQINSVWFKKATELGLDITKEVDNEKMAYFIFENYGTGMWSASANCWNR